MIRRISATILHVEEGYTTILTAGTAEELLDQLKRNLSSGIVLTAIADEDYDDPYEIVADTVDDPLADLTIEDARRYLEQAKESGYAIPPELDAELFLAMHNDMKQEVTLP